MRDNSPRATNTPEPTSYVRPQTQVVSYSPSPAYVYPGQNLDFVITLQSVGQITARNVTATFVTGDLVPRETGGVHFIGDMDPGATTTFPQPLRVSSQISKGEAVMKLEVVYYDDFGQQYTDNFDVAVFPVSWGTSSATATPTVAIHPQISLTGYKTDPAVLAPGTVFTLDLDLTNLSGDTARQLVVDLNSSSTGTSTAGSSTIFPVNSSSSRYVDVLETGQTAHLTFNMGVSGSATGQFVPVSLNMTYYDSTSTQRTQTENLSLRIDTKPNLYVHFLTDPPSPVLVGDSLDLPVEVINIGSDSLNVSTIEVTSDKLTVSNGSLYIGPLDAGTSGTVPSQMVADQPGTAAVTVTINYLDDFQQAQKATFTLTVEIMDQPTPEPEQLENGGQGNNPQGELSVFDRILRAVLGFFGLSTRDSGFSGGGGNFNGGGPNGGGNGGGGGGGRNGGGGGNGGNGGVAG